MVTFVDDVDILMEDTGVTAVVNPVDNFIGEIGIIGETVLIEGSEVDTWFWLLVIDVVLRLVLLKVVYLGTVEEISKFPELLLRLGEAEVWLTIIVLCCEL